MDDFTTKIEALLDGLASARRTVVATGSGLYVRSVEAPGPEQAMAQRELQRLWDANPDAVWRVVTEYHRAEAAPRSAPPVV